MLNKLKYEVFGAKRDDSFSSIPGDKMKQTYRMKIDESGKEVLIEDDLIDIQAEIDSYEEEVNVNNIIARYMAGDENALDRAKAFFADVSKVPKNFAQILELNNRAKQEFNLLPADVKELFNGDYIDFLNNPQKLDEYIKKNYAKSNDVVDKVEKVNDAGEQKSAD